MTLQIGMGMRCSEMFVTSSYLPDKEHELPAFFSLKGFTFIEILLVVVLLGVLVAVSVPNLQASFKTLLLKDTAQDMATLMRYAQSRAIVKKTTIEFVYDDLARSYALFQSDGGQDLDDGQRELKRISGKRGRDFRIPSEIECKTTDSRITFTPDGKMSYSRLYLCLSEKCMTVSTQDQAGRVLLLEGTFE